MHLNRKSQRKKNYDYSQPGYYAGIELDIFQIMSNHIHGIIVINPVGVDPCAHPHPPIFVTIRINGIRMKITFNRNQKQNE